jgi:hypothetical protein
MLIYTIRFYPPKRAEEDKMEIDKRTVAAMLRLTSHYVRDVIASLMEEVAYSEIAARNAYDREEYLLSLLRSTDVDPDEYEDPLRVPQEYLN